MTLTKEQRLKGEQLLRDEEEENQRKKKKEDRERRKKEAQEQIPLPRRPQPIYGYPGASPQVSAQEIPHITTRPITRQEPPRAEEYSWFCPKQDTRGLPPLPKPRLPCYRR